MASVSDVIHAMEGIAPLEGAADWDNVGLLVGEQSWPASTLMLTIDLTPAVLDEARSGGVQMIVAYHPPIFQPLTSISDTNWKERLILRAARSGVAIYSPHTALDAAPEGINDWLAQGLGDGDVRALEPAEHLPRTEETKVVTFCPPDTVDRLRNGLAAVGAGRIGEYEQCSFELRGTGTFYGRESAKPAVGEKGRLERVEETRLEMVCPVRSLALAVMTIRQFHPYDEPPIEIYPLRSRPRRDSGHGRRVVLDRAVSLKTIAERIRRTIGTRRILAAAAPEAPRLTRTIGVCAGSGGALLGRALDEGCEAYFTGEMRHHDVIEAQSRGCTVLLAGHTNTERGYLKVLRKRLQETLKETEIAISRRDGDPLKLMKE